MLSTSTQKTLSSSLNTATRAAFVCAERGHQLPYIVGFGPKWSDRAGP